MYNNFECLGHSSIKIINGNQIIYIDPYDLEENKDIANIILITHSHYDHFSKQDILKIKDNNTLIVITEDIYDEVQKLGFSKSNIICVIPNEKYNIDDLLIETIPAYNIDKQFHLKEKNWVGYIITINAKRYYIAGDTDITEENLKVICDILFVPVGGVYTMDYKEAAELTNKIKPQIAVPIHYGKIVGTKQDALNYQKLLDKDIECKIFF